MRFNRRVGQLRAPLHVSIREPESGCNGEACFVNREVVMQRLEQFVHAEAISIYSYDSGRE